MISSMEKQLWQYITTHNCPCKVIEEEKLWGQTICRVWLPEQDAVVKVLKSVLQPLDSELQSDAEKYRIGYIAAASKVAEILEGSSSVSDGQVLLAPMESNVIPLPHQINVLSRAISSDRVRYLLADEVGLGKTIEAGLILRELKLRGLVRRTLVVTPKSIAMQWVAEMSTHFSEAFSLINPGDLDALERLERPTEIFNDIPLSPSDYNPWFRFPQAIVTLDAVKPLAKRRGWSKEKIQKYNSNRYEKLVHGKWDLIIVDEAHRLGGSTDQVARFKLGQGLSEAAPYLLLLSATPHQGKTDAFARLMSLLDPMTFPDAESITRERVADFVLRTEKRKSVTAHGDPLFKARTTRTQKINLRTNPQQVVLYNEVTAYVKDGYNQAVKDRKPHIGFLMVLLQRIVTSSTYAIRCTLERRLNVLEEMGNDVKSGIRTIQEDLEELTAQEQLNELIEINEPERLNEIEQVKFLLSLARDSEISGPDVKTTILLDLIYQIQGEEGDDQLKLLIFTEFVSTQEMLKQFLEERGIICATLNGSMSMDERRMAQRKFRDDARIMISTDAGGEGLNLQFCHIVINYDLPWNPMRIEQRIGRVDRIGQKKIVRAINFIYEDSIEYRVREVLENKLAIILDEIGINKADDILESSFSGEMIEKMMTQIVMEDIDPETEVQQTVNELKNNLVSIREESPVYGVSDEPDLAAAEKLRTHPLPHWLERMTINFLQMKNCTVEKKMSAWDLTWPDGEVMESVGFQSDNLHSNISFLTLENSRVRGLALNLPIFAYGQPVPGVRIDGLPSSIKGLWGLFEIRLQAGLKSNGQYIRIPMLRRRYSTVFISDEGKLFQQTANHIWESLQTEVPSMVNYSNRNDSTSIYTTLTKAAEETGQKLFDDLRSEHMASIAREENRGMTAFSARRKAIERVGLPEVRQYRMNLCNKEESEWRGELDSAREIIPEICPLMILRIDEDSCNE